MCVTNSVQGGAGRRGGVEKQGQLWGRVLQAGCYLRAGGEIGMVCIESARPARTAAQVPEAGSSGGATGDGAGAAIKGRGG